MTKAAPHRSALFSRDHVRLIFVAVTRHSIVVIGEEFGQCLAFAGLAAVSASVSRSGSGSQPVSLEQPLGLPRHVGSS